MSATLVKKENNTVSIKFAVDAKTFEEGVQKAYLKNRGKFNIQGFRKGKVPRKIIEMNYGVGVFYEEAVNIILPEAYDNAVKELGLDTVDRPSIDIEQLEKGKEVVFTAEVTVKPEVELSEYKGIEVEKVEYNVTEEDIENELKAMQNQNARIIEVSDREVKEGDTLTIDYAGFVGEDQFEGGTAKNQTLEIGSKTFIPGFEDQLVGKNKGEEVEVNVKFPEEYQAENLAGKDAIFKVTIHEIKEKELPELDDEFAKDASEFETLEELKTDIKNKLEEETNRKEKVEKENKVLAKVAENAKTDIPEAMIENEIDNEIKNFEYSLMYQGLNMEKYLELTNSSMENLREQIKPSAEKRVLNDLILETVAVKEGIEVTDEELNIELEKLAKQYKQELDKFKATIREEEMEVIKKGIAKTKAVQILIDNAKFA